MNVTIQDEKIGKRQRIIYTVIALICVLSIIIAFYVQFYARIDLLKYVGISEETTLANKSEEEVENLRTKFEQGFSNNVINNETTQNSKKIDDDKEIVYTNYNVKENKESSYDLDVSIPQINIKSEIVDKYNEEIKNTFEDKAKNSFETQNKNIVYTVEYVANIKEDILSLIILSKLKDGATPQRTVVKTYNYDLRNDKEVSLNEFLGFKQVNKVKVQSEINKVISAKQADIESLNELGYNIYSRNKDDDMYKIENSNEFFITEDSVYIIYAYGNNHITSELDLIIL